jgi:hypothetical protein
MAPHRIVESEAVMPIADEFLKSPADAAEAEQLRKTLAEVRQRLQKALRPEK